VADQVGVVAKLHRPVAQPELQLVARLVPVAQPELPLVPQLVAKPAPVAQPEPQLVPQPVAKLVPVAQPVERLVAPTNSCLLVSPVSRRVFVVSSQPQGW